MGYCNVRGDPCCMVCPAYPVALMLYCDYMLMPFVGILNVVCPCLMCLYVIMTLTMRVSITLGVAAPGHHF